MLLFSVNYLFPSMSSCFSVMLLVNVCWKVILMSVILCRTRVTLKRDGVVLDLVPPPTKVNNLIFGRTWVDSPGDMIMTNLTTGDKVVLYFQPCGWFGYSLYHVLIIIFKT